MHLHRDTGDLPGKDLPGSVTELLSGGPRAAAGFTVPAKGLCLMEVRYRETADK